MRRGDIYWVDLEPATGNEANKIRPAILVSNDAVNHRADRLGRGVVTVVPLTSNTARVHPFQVMLTAAETGLPTDSKAQAEQVRSISVRRLGKHAGRVAAKQLRAVDNALRLHLDL